VRVMRTRRLGAIALAIVALGGAGALVGCGDDDDDGEETTETAEVPVEEVTLVADDAGGNYTFELSETPTPETERVIFQNQGQQPHILVFARINEGFTVDEAFELQGRKGSAVEMAKQTEAGPGKSKTVEIVEAIEPGNYAMLCPIPGPGGKAHYELGQLAEFTIE
jgi:hypothetical protein